MLGVADVADDLRSVARVAPEVLLAALGVLGDDGVRRLEDGLRRAVVLLEQDRARRGSPPRTPRCCGSSRRGRRRWTGPHRRPPRARPGHAGTVGTRHTRAVGTSDQLAHELVLRMVGVLVLVDEDVAEPAPVVLGDLREGLQDVDRRHDQVVEVQRVGLPQPPLVAGVGLGEHPLVVRALGHPRGKGLLVDELVLEVGHLVAERPRRVALGVEVEVAHDHRHQPLAVGGVVDRERRLHADLGPPGAGCARTHCGTSSPTSPWRGDRPGRPPARASRRRPCW